MIEVDGSCYSGSGTIVRQGVALAALTGQSLHIVNARVRRPKPGLRAQHVRVVQAICELVGGTAEGLEEGSRELVFRPGAGRAASKYRWDIGTAGSATMLAVAVLLVLAFQRQAVRVHIQGGLFQDFAPSVFHTQQVLLPLLRGMGLEAELTMLRPGYVPRGDGQVVVATTPTGGLRELVLEDPGRVERVWGIALASHLQAPRVGVRMAEAARAVLAAGGQRRPSKSEMTRLRRGPERPWPCSPIVAVGSG